MVELTLSAFDNKDELKRPHKVVDGKIIPNIHKNGDKYTAKGKIKFIK